MNLPFSLNSATAYSIWRDSKLKDYPTCIEDLFTVVNEPKNLSAKERLSIQRICAKTNFAFYESKRPMDKSDVRALGQQLGLLRLDHNLCADNEGISSLETGKNGNVSEYIPYTNRLLNWHTDGYYNSDDSQIRAFILHCVNPAETGGETRLLDHELVYLLLREKNPDFILALMYPDAMTIPENRKDGKVIRSEKTGPVFSVSPEGALHVRYTARTRSIRWKNDTLLSQARKHLVKIIDDNCNVFRHTLQSNQGVICNNSLHARTKFQNSAKNSRLVYRARYHDRVRVWGLTE